MRSAGLRARPSRRWVAELLRQRTERHGDRVAVVRAAEQLRRFAVSGRGGADGGHGTSSQHGDTETRRHGSVRWLFLQGAFKPRVA
jgi:hypothetical protein